MGLINLLYIASMPVVKVLLIIAVGLFLALDNINLLGQNSRKNLNEIVFYVFNPAFVGSNLAKTITFKSFVTLWFMPVNILLTFVIGSVLGWVLVKITKAPKHLHGLIIGTCSAGNLGNLLMIIVPALCEENGTPFGATDVCKSTALGYASLSMALGALFIWSYVYNIVRIYSRNTIELKAVESIEEISVDCTEPLLSSTDYSDTTSINEVTFAHRTKEWMRNFSKKINLSALLAPTTIGAIVGFAIGMISPIRKLLIGSDAILHVIQDSAFMIGDAAIPSVTLILGANLLGGLKGVHIQLRNVIGIVIVRYIILPVIGVLIVKGTVHYGLIQPDPLFQFVLLLQYALPPATSIGTITQLFGVGQSECSVIMLWTYALSSVALTLWSTFFLWLVAQ